jgi:hypothetical protein
VKRLAVLKEIPTILVYRMAENDKATSDSAVESKAVNTIVLNLVADLLLGKYKEYKK